MYNNTIAQDHEIHYDRDKEHWVCSCGAVRDSLAEACHHRIKNQLLRKLQEAPRKNVFELVGR